LITEGQLIRRLTKPNSVVSVTAKINDNGNTSNKYSFLWEKDMINKSSQHKYSFLSSGVFCSKRIHNIDNVKSGRYRVTVRDKHNTTTYKEFVILDPINDTNTDIDTQPNFSRSPEDIPDIPNVPLILSRNTSDGIISKNIGSGFAISKSNKSNNSSNNISPNTRTRDLAVGIPPTTILQNTDIIVITDLLANCNETFDMQLTPSGITELLLNYPIIVRVINNTDGTIKTYNSILLLQFFPVFPGNRRGLYTVVLTDIANRSITYSFVVIAPDLCSVRISPCMQYLKCSGSNNGVLTAELVLDKIVGYEWCSDIIAYYYSWSRTDGDIITYIDPVTGNNLTSQVWTQDANQASNLSAGSYTVCVYEVCGTGDQSKTSETVCGSATIKQPRPLTLELCPTRVCLDCYGDTNGVVRAYPANGTPPYTYSVYAYNNETSSYDIKIGNPQSDGKITGLGAGLYTLVVYDNSGCSISKTFILTQPPKLKVLISVSRYTQADECNDCDTCDNDSSDPSCRELCGTSKSNNSKPCIPCNMPNNTSCNTLCSMARLEQLCKYKHQNKWKTLADKECNDRNEHYHDKCHDHHNHDHHHHDDNSNKGGNRYDPVYNPQHSNRCDIGHYDRYEPLNGQHNNKVYEKICAPLCDNVYVSRPKHDNFSGIGINNGCDDTGAHVNKYVEWLTGQNSCKQPRKKYESKEECTKLCAIVSGGYYCPDTECTINDKCGKCSQSNVYTYEWRNLNDVDTIIGTTNCIDVNKNGTYQVKVLTTNGCVDTDEVKVKIKCFKTKINKVYQTISKFRIKVHSTGGIKPYTYEVNGQEYDSEEQLECQSFTTNKNYNLVVTDSIGDTSCVEF
jgi:hypothetical protein